MYRNQALAFSLTATLLLTAGCTPNVHAAPVNKPMQAAAYDETLDLDSQLEADSSFHCSTNKFTDGLMIKRTHSGDENGSSEVKCANFIQAGSRLKYESAAASTIEEKQSDYPEGGIVCPADKFMVGRDHSGDENGNTTYYCRGLVGHWGETIKKASAYWTDWKAEDDFDLECSWDEAITGFDHEGDENGRSRIQCAKLL